MPHLNVNEREYRDCQCEELRELKYRVSWQDGIENIKGVIISVLQGNSTAIQLFKQMNSTLSQKPRYFFSVFSYLIEIKENTQS